METIAKGIVAQYASRMWMKLQSFQLCSTKPTKNARFFRTTASSSKERRDVASSSFQKTLRDLNPYAQASGMILGVMAGFAGAASFVTNEIAKTKAEVALADLKNDLSMEKDRELAKKDDEIVACKARLATAEHKAMVANQFLVFGYAEEFTRYQKEAGIYKDGKLSEQVDEANEDGKSSKQRNEKGQAESNF